MKNVNIRELTINRDLLLKEYLSKREDGTALLLRMLLYILIASIIGYQVTKNLLHLDGFQVFVWTFVPAIVICFIGLIMAVCGYIVAPTSTTQKYIDMVLGIKIYSRAIAKEKLSQAQELLIHQVQHQVKSGNYENIQVLIESEVFQKNLVNNYVVTDNNEICERLKTFKQKYGIVNDDAFNNISDDLYIKLYSNKTLAKEGLVSSIPLMQLLGNLGFENYSQVVINQIIQSSDNIKQIFIGFKNDKNGDSPEHRSRETIA